MNDKLKQLFEKNSERICDLDWFPREYKVMSELQFESAVAEMKKWMICKNCKYYEYDLHFTHDGIEEDCETCSVTSYQELLNGDGEYSSCVYFKSKGE